MKYLVLLLLSLIVVDAVSISQVQKKLLKDLLLRELRSEAAAGGSETAEEEGEGGDSQSSEESIRDQILAKEGEYMEYFRTQNFQALSDLYIDDAYYCVPGMDCVVGKTAIQEGVWIPGSGEGDNNEVLTFESTIIIDAGDYQIGHGTWDVKENPDVVGTNNLIADGTYLTVYKNVDGEWLIEVDIINMKTVYAGGAEEEAGADDTGAADTGAADTGDATAAGDNEVSRKRLLVKALKNLLGEKKQKRVTPGVLHRRGLH